jgi:prepilin-type N-terminal cleavage/methylation domain-containing protein
MTFTNEHSMKRNPKASGLQPTAFTLLEMTVTLTILGLVAALVTVNYRQPIANARLQQTFEQIDSLDRRVRIWCKTNNSRARINVDLDRGVFVAEKEDGEKLNIPEVKMPDGFTIKELRLLGENRFGRDTRIPYTSHGTTTLWAYSISSSSVTETWRMMIGATGQSKTLENEDELREIERMIEN